MDANWLPLTPSAALASEVAPPEPLSNIMASRQTREVQVQVSRIGRAQWASARSASAVAGAEQRPVSRDGYAFSKRPRR